MMNNNAEVDDHALDRLIPEIRCPGTLAEKMQGTTQSLKSDIRKPSISCVKHAKNNQCTIYMKRCCP